MMLKKNKHLHLVTIMVAAVVLATLVETSNAERVFGPCEKKDFIDKGLDWTTNWDAKGCESGVTTLYKGAERELFITGLIVVGIIVLVIAICCCCCISCCRCISNCSRSTPRSLPPPAVRNSNARAVHTKLQFHSTVTI